MSITHSHAILASYMQLPSNKVGFVLIFVVLAVASTIFFTKVQKNGLLTDLENVSLTIARNTSAAGTGTDSDSDGLTDWQETLYGSDRNNPDSDGDGTNDGEEVSVKRDPAKAGPDDPLLMSEDMFNTVLDYSTVASGTPTEKMSIDLFTQYVNMTRSQSLTEESQQELVNEIAQKTVSQVDFKPHYASSDLTVTASSPDGVKAYGTIFAKTALTNLTYMDSLKTLSDTQYIPRIIAAYREYADEMAAIEVPDVAQEIHLKIINSIYQTSDLIELLVETEQDPVTALVAIGVHESSGNDDYLYTSMADYFKNNDILFDDTNVTRFWNYFESQ